MAGGVQQMLDPRTLLPLVAVPPQYLPAFAAMDGTVFHWMGPVAKVTASGQERDKVGVVGDAALYVCNSDGAIRRSIPYADLKELVIRSDDDRLGLRMAIPGEHDVLLRILGEAPVHAFVFNALKRIYWVHKGKDLPVTRLRAMEPIVSQLQLQRAMFWNLKLEPLRSVRFLKTLANDEEATARRLVMESSAEFQRIKAELEEGIGACRQAKYDVMVQQSVRDAQRISQQEARIAVLTKGLQMARQHVFDSSVGVSLDRLLVEDAKAARGGVERGSASGAAPIGLPVPEPRVPSQHAVSPHSGASGGNLSPRGGAGCLSTPNDGTTPPPPAATEGISSFTSSSPPAMNMPPSSFPPDPRALAEHRAAKKALLILNDERLTPAVRIQAVLGVLHRATTAGQFAAAASSAGGIDAVESLQAEVRALRSTLSDVAALHLAELAEVRGEFERYDALMVASVRQALAQHGHSSPNLVADASADCIVAEERVKVQQLLVPHGLSGRASQTATAEASSSERPILSHPQAGAVTDADRSPSQAVAHAPLAAQRNARSSNDTGRRSSAAHLRPEPTTRASPSNPALDAQREPIVLGASSPYRQGGRAARPSSMARNHPHQRLSSSTQRTTQADDDL